MIKSLVKYLVYSSHLVAAVTAGCALAPLMYLGVSNFFEVLAFIYASTFLIYNIDRLLHKSPEDKINHPERVLWFQIHSRGLFIQMIPAVGISIYFLSLCNWQSAVLLISFLFICMMYIYPIIPGRKGKFSLKSTSLGKPVIIAFIWSGITVLFPVILTNSGITSAIFFYYVTCFSLAFINAMYFDLKDLKGDQAEGLTTYAVINGFDNSVLLTNKFSTCSIIFMLVIFAISFNLIPLVLSVVAVYLMNKMGRSMVEKKQLHSVLVMEMILLLPAIGFLLPA